MNLDKLESYIKLAKEFAAVQDLTAKEIKVYDNSIYVITKDYGITIGSPGNIKNKFLHVTIVSPDYSRDAIFKYKKSPENTVGSTQQRPSKANLFNIMLERNIPFSFEDLSAFEGIMDTIDYVVQIRIDSFKTYK